MATPACRRRPPDAVARCAGLLVGLCWAAGAAAAPPVTAQAHSPYGINIHIPAGEELERKLDEVAAAGIGWVRIDFVWAYVEAQRGSYYWHDYDQLVAAAELRGLEILALIAYTPQWATDGPEISGVPREVEDWRRFCTQAAARYRGSIRVWEVWNEPNLPRFWVGTRDEYFQRILIPGADALRAGNPQALIAGPALAHLSSASWYRWLPAVLEAAGDRLDILTHHVYGTNGYDQTTRRLNGSTLFGSNPALWGLVAPSLREVLAHVGAVGRPLWLTETGWESAVRGEAAQADDYRGFLGDWYAGNPSRSWIEKVFFYELEDPPTEHTWGILRADGSRKEAFWAYRDFILEHPPANPALPLHEGRFAVSVRWRDQRTGNQGAGHPVGYSRESGLFWFFGPDNTELSVKVLDGGPVNGHFWVFYGALSDVEYWLTVTDQATGTQRHYHNPPGTICGRADTSAFASGGPATAGFEAGAGSVGLLAAGTELAPRSAGCTPDGNGLCLNQGRFRVEAEWHDQRSGAQGPAQAVAAAGDSGYFWFFNPSNLELVVKVLDGRGVNGRFWVFYSAMSDVEYWVTVTDTVTGAERRYHNPPYTFCGNADTLAF
jgi:polysaccharide biosynthesis protein PslG